MYPEYAERVNAYAHLRNVFPGQTSVSTHSIIVIETIVRREAMLERVQNWMIICIYYVNICFSTL